MLSCLRKTTIALKKNQFCVRLIKLFFFSASVAHYISLTVVEGSVEQPSINVRPSAGTFYVGRHQGFLTFLKSPQAGTN